MGTNFYWIKKAEDIKPLDWQISLREEIEELEDKSPSSILTFTEKYVKNNLWIINKNEREASEESEEEEYSRHIGKRSAAGNYCWDCNKTLCKSGESRIHFGGVVDDWHNSCPSCKKKPNKDNLSSNFSMVELGFEKPNSLRPTGVQSCASFTWAQNSDEVLKKCNENLEEKIIIDEYGRELTCQEFIDMLDNNCPITFSHLVGSQFC